MAHCNIEIPSSIVNQLTGTINAYLTEDGGNDPVNVLSKGAHYDVVVEVELNAALKRLICGSWCICVAAESVGNAGEPRTCADPLLMTNCDDEPEVARVSLPEDWFAGNEDACGDVFNLAVTVVAKNQCDEPMGIAGFCELGPVMVQ